MICKDGASDNNTGMTLEKYKISVSHQPLCPSVLPVEIVMLQITSFCLACVFQSSMQKKKVKKVKLNSPKEKWREKNPPSKKGLYCIEMSITLHDHTMAALHVKYHKSPALVLPHESPFRRSAMRVSLEQIMCTLVANLLPPPVTVLSDTKTTHGCGCRSSN